MSLRQRQPQDAAATADEVSGGAGVATAEGGGGAAESAAAVEAKRRGIGEALQRFFISPQWKACVLVVVGFVPCFGIAMALPVSLKVLGCSPTSKAAHYAVSMHLTLLFLYNFFQAQTTDPGGADKVKPTFESTGQFQMLFGDTSGNGDSEQNDMVKQIDSSDPLMYAPNYCNQCKHWKPPRTHHCSICKRCTLRMDHHCPFTGNCIGLRNHGHFLLMYVFAAVGLLYASVIVFVGVVESFKAPHKMGMPLPPKLREAGYFAMTKYSVMILLRYTDPALLVQGLLTSVALSAVLGLGLTAWSQALRGTTMLEQMFPMKEYVQIKLSTYCPLGNGFYDLGWRQNARDLLGPSWKLRLLLPIKGAPLDWRVGVAPQPSQVGIDALVGRIRQVEVEGVSAPPVSNEQLGINPGPEAGVAKNV